MMKILKNYAEGTMKFNAIVTYDPTVYNTTTLSSSSELFLGINLYQYPDIVTFKTDSARFCLVILQVQADMMPWQQKRISDI